MDLFWGVDFLFRILGEMFVRDIQVFWLLFQHSNIDSQILVILALFYKDDKEYFALKKTGEKRKCLEIHTKKNKKTSYFTSLQVY